MFYLLPFQPVSLAVEILSDRILAAQEGPDALFRKPVLLRSHDHTKGPHSCRNGLRIGKISFRMRELIAARTNLQHIILLKFSSFIAAKVLTQHCCPASHDRIGSDPAAYRQVRAAAAHCESKLQNIACLNA